MSLASISNKNQTVEAFFDDFSLSDQRSGIHPSFSQKKLGSIGFENHALLGLHLLDNIKNRLKAMNEQVRGVDEKKMVRTPCCEKMGLKKGPWTPDEDQILISFVQQFGHGNWRALPKQAGLLRCGKSCRLRWINYLRPDIKRGNFTKDEEDTIIKLHQTLGNRWSTIAAKLPGRTDNEIKNYWHTRLKKRTNLSTYKQRHCSNETAMLQRDINHATMSPNPGNFTTHQGIQSAPGNIQLVSRQKFQLDLPDSMEITTRRQVDTVGRVTEVSPRKVSENERKCSVARDGAITEAMKCDNSNDMEFWYNVLMKAGNSIEVQENLGSTSIVR